MRTFIVAFCLVLAAPAAGAPLSEVALYHRCYVRLTGEFPDYLTDTRLAQVRSSAMTAVDACMEVVDAATFQNQGGQETPQDSDLGRTVLAAFQTLHSSWFLNRVFPSDDDISLGTESVYEAGEPAAYITRALFNRAVPASSIFTAQDHLRVLRAPGGPPLFEFEPSEFAYDNPPLLTIGEVVGIDIAGPLRRSMRIVDPEDPESGADLEIGRHLGGGFIGSAGYLLQSVKETLDFVANGGRKMPRKWAKAVLHDALCRELPVVRTEDAIPYVVADSAVPFRRQARCSQCHATIDRMASTIRGFRYRVVGDEGVGGLFGAMSPPVLSAESGWPAVEDPEFGERPTRGTLYLRDHAGQLIDLPLDGPGALGARLAELDGPYICLAKRYYRYFTGIDAFIGDPDNFPAGAGSRDAYYRNLVIDLGRKLRADGDLRALIEAIFRSPDYRESDFGVSR